MDRMSWYKKAQNRPPQGFLSEDVRRLHGIMIDFQSLAKKADEEMQSWLDNEEYDISFEEAKKRLSYYLARLQLLD
jgi:hypothetical protein